MTKTAVSRRALLGSGACALAGAATVARIASAHAETGLSSKNAEIVRNYYRAWETKDWHPVDVLLTNDFTFTSPNDDDHISKSVFKARCWESQIAFIKHFDLTQVIGSGNDVFVLYLCHTTNGKTFRNVEYLQLRDAQVQAIECFFGGQHSFPSAVSGQK
jgi:hypothetical protein